MSRSVLKQLQLHLSPPPRNISESRAILRALEKFGEIDMFKVLRFEDTTKDFTPRAHIIFKNPSSSSSLLTAGTLTVPSTNITVTASESIFKHEEYIEYASASRIVKDETLLGRLRTPGLPLPTDEEMLDSSIPFGSDSHMAPSAQRRGMKSRMLGRYTRYFLGFKDLEMRMKIEQEQSEFDAYERRREENKKLARGEEVDLSGESGESIQKNQLNTVQDIIGELSQVKR